LPLEYVIEAYSRGLKLRRFELHEYERPHALHMSMIANFNRDPESQSEAFSPENFFLYEASENGNLPDNRYGAAALALIREELFPSWALFCYKDLSARSSGAIPPILAFISEDAILLAPIAVDDGFKGLLIAKEKASDQWIAMESPCGKKEMLYVPRIDSKIVANEDVILNRR